MDPVLFVLCDHIALTGDLELGLLANINACSGASGDLVVFAHFDI